MYFAYRSHYDGPLSKVVRHFPDTTILGWFQRNWTTPDAEDWLENELGSDVYGLHSIFDAATEHALPVPQSMRGLETHLREHLYVEGGSEHIQMDEQSLRVLTDDDEVELAYFFLDDTAIAASPDRFAYLLHEHWPLPTTAETTAPFTPAIPVTPAWGEHDGAGATYLALLTFDDGASIACRPPIVFPGVRIVDFTARLRAIAPHPSWPDELKALRGLLDADDTSIAPALARCNVWPGFNLNEQPWRGDHEETDIAAARAAERARLPEVDDERYPEKSLLEVSDHIVQFAMHCHKFFGFQQWFFFDDVWANTNHDLAQSLLRYAAHWDPMTSVTP